MSGLLFILIEKTNVYVLFNAWQSIFLSIALSVFWIICIIIDRIIFATATGYYVSVFTLIAVCIILGVESTRKVYCIIIIILFQLIVPTSVRFTILLTRTNRISSLVFMMYRAYIGVQKGEITILPLIGNWAYNQSYGKDGGQRASKSEAAAESGRAPEAPSTGPTET